MQESCLSFLTVEPCHKDWYFATSSSEWPAFHTIGLRNTKSPATVSTIFPLFLPPGEEEDIAPLQQEIWGQEFLRWWEDFISIIHPIIDGIRPFPIQFLKFLSRAIFQNFQHVKNESDLRFLACLISCPPTAMRPDQVPRIRNNEPDQVPRIRNNEPDPHLRQLPENRETSQLLSHEYKRCSKPLGKDSYPETRFVYSPPFSGTTRRRRMGHL